jgi:hypothetical protein
VLDALSVLPFSGLLLAIIATIAIGLPTPYLLWTALAAPLNARPAVELTASASALMRYRPVSGR